MSASIQITFLVILAASLAQSQDTLVRVDLFVMSKCPDAEACEDLYDGVVAEVGTIIDLHVNYIASVNSSTQTGFQCMHGQSECVGNLQQVCAYDLYPDNYTWYHFIVCQDQSRQLIPTNAEYCADKFDMDYDTLTSCADGTQGSTLLTQSIEYTQSQGVTVSCSMYINGQLYCVHDGGWVDCQGTTVEETVDYICSLYQGNSKPVACVV